MKVIRIITAMFLTAALAAPSMAQNKETHDPAAKKVLEKISTTTQSYQSLRATFDWTLENKAEKTKDTKQGYMFIKGNNKYKLILQGTEIFSNGTDTWTYSKEANEITVNAVDETEESIVSNPTKIFSLYEKGFKYSLKGEEQKQIRIKADGKVSTVKKNCYVIDLYPESPKGKEFHTIELIVDKATTQIYSIDIKFKNGSDQIIEILDYKPNVAMPDNLFIYEESKYPGAELNDMR
ncbi:MAG: outer membrane lipoprotein carrier protein LolA [Bacteroidales bacterium]|nr:outer membrane lipoprotein carrier protein LolA [Bacteroidales bacterium]